MSKAQLSLFTFALCLGAAACSSNGGSTGTSSDGGTQGSVDSGAGGNPGTDGGLPATNTDAGSGGGTSGHDAGGGTGGTDAGSGTGGHDAGGGTGGTDAGSTPINADAGTSTGDAGAAVVATSLTGTLGSLGAVQPIVSSIVISNSGETLVYLSSSTITCTMLQTSRWLGGTTAGSQVVEVVIKGNPSVGQTVQVPPGEVNYAPGGKSSSYEVVAASGTITFTRADPQGVVEGTVSATYTASGGGSVSGTFHADFCANGQNY